MYVLRILIAQPLRLILTLSGIALCVILILFILGIYNGVAEGSIEYVRQGKADLWILQANTTNIMRGTSILPASYTDIIADDDRIESVTPVLLLLTNIKARGRDATVLLTGYVPGLMGGPPKITNGRNILHDNEIVLDRSFAAKYQIPVGQEVEIQDHTLKVVGLSSGTNAFVTQYAFVTYDFEQSVIELPGLASFFMLKVKSGRNLNEIISGIDKKLPGKLSIYKFDKFLQNNIAEMEAGILPLFYAIAVIGAVVLAIILSLILSVNILERRRDFAIMKVIGSPKGFLDYLIILQAMILALSSEVTGVILFFPMKKLIEAVSSEITTKIGSEHIIYVTIVTAIVSLFSSAFSLRRIRKIYPLEVFS